MLERKAMDRFRFWKEHKSKQALLVTGARQVGKSYLIKKFAEESYQTVVYFDLVEDRAAVRSFSEAENAQDLLFRISVLSGRPLQAGQTVVVFDEVQECPELVTSIKFLADQGDYDYILSGSLLGVALQNVRSIPVGYLTEVHMYPLDFEEFCWASGLPKESFDLLRECAEGATPVPDYLHERLLALFRRYLIVGGMPDVVSAYLKDNALDQVRIVQNDISRLYREDISKYAPKDRALVVRNIYDLIPSELLKENRRFRLGSIEGVKRYSTVQDEFLWLVDAGVALAETNVSAPTSPLLMNEKRGMFKLFMCDVGLLTGSYVRQTAQDILDDTRTVNLGGIYENFVAQELRSKGFELWYYSDSGRRVGELDAVVERADGTSLVFEVKSGGGYRTHVALDKALATWPDARMKAFVLSNGNVEADEAVTYLPVYMVGLFSPDDASL